MHHKVGSPVRVTASPRTPEPIQLHRERRAGAIHPRHVPVVRVPLPQAEVILLLHAAIPHLPGHQEVEVTPHLPGQVEVALQEVQVEVHAPQVEADHVHLVVVEDHLVVVEEDKN